MNEPDAGPGPQRAGAVAIALIASMVVAGVLLGGVGVAAASHGPESTNFTYTPLSADDRRPGADTTRVGMIGQAAEGVDTDFETLLRLKAVWRAGSWEGCGPTTSEVFGIDRNSDNEPYEVDKELTTNVKSFTAREDVFETRFYDEGDFGETVNLNSDDRIFSVIECPDNPAEAGWHRIDEASVRGRTADGEEITYTDPSHWFWICNCKNEAEARDRLGPPPSEPEETAVPTPTATAGSTPASGTTTPSRTGPTDTARSTETRGAAAETATPRPTAADRTATRRSRTPTSAAGEWADYQVRTPTVNSGSGFQPLAGITAVLVAIGIRRWWRRT